MRLKVSLFFSLRIDLGRGRLDGVLGEHDLEFVLIIHFKSYRKFVIKYISLKKVINKFIHQ